MGFPIEQLREIEDRWLPYNLAIASPFLQFKKHKIAKALKKGNVEIGEGFIAEHRIAKVGVGVYPYYLNGTKFCDIQKGDRCISRIFWEDPKKAVEFINSKDLPTFIFVNQECLTQTSMMKGLGFKFLGSKINSFGDIQGAWYRGPDRKHPKLSIQDQATSKRLELPKGQDIACSILEDLHKLNPSYSNHPSNYNRDKSWSAVSLRGYSNDPMCIVDGNLDQPEDTSIRSSFKELDSLLAAIPGKYHRIRIMNLSSKGELARHTDQEDKGIGVEDGKIMRFHLPLETCPGVQFQVWEHGGEPDTFHMGRGELWYIDIRKPHRAINKGILFRSHLVVDVEASPELRRIVFGS